MTLRRQKSGPIRLIAGMARTALAKGARSLTAKAIPPKTKTKAKAREIARAKAKAKAKAKARRMKFAKPRAAPRRRGDGRYAIHAGVKALRRER